MASNLSRRAILTGAGAALALPFLPSFRGGSSSGVMSMPTAKAEGIAPKRIVFWLNWWGTLHKYWTPKNTSADGKSFDLNEIMAPLAKYKDRMGVLSGVNMVSVYNQVGRQGMHDIGNANMLTSAGYEIGYPYGPSAPYYIGKGPSIDQVIADKLSSPTKLRYLYSGDGSGHNNSVVLNAQRQMLAPLYGPDNVFDVAFGDYQDDPAARERLKAERTSVVDAVLPAYKSLSSRVSPSDKGVVDAHLDAMIDLERRIKINTACAPPPLPAAGIYDPVADRIYYADPKGPYEDHVEVLARALACDITRVATFAIEGARAQAKAIIPGFDQYIGNADVHALTHCPAGDVTGNEVLKRFHIWRSSLLAKFLDVLDQTIDIDGRSVLDNTCVVSVSEIMTGLHDTIPGQEWGYSNLNDTSIPADTRPVGLPIFYVGGLGGALRTGIHLDLTKTNTYADKLGKYSHGELYLTLARAMGIDAAQLPTFGDPACCKNLVTEMRA